MTYNELVTNIRNYTEVGANVFTEPVINVFITFAENRILRDIDLDVFKLEVTSNLTTSNKFLTAPTDILTHRYLIVALNQCIRSQLNCPKVQPPVRPVQKQQIERATRRLKLVAVCATYAASLKCFFNQVVNRQIKGCCI